MKNNKIVVEYNSNNSGGGWWLKDKDWLNLERFGWKLHRGAFIYSNGEYTYDENGIPKFKEEKDYKYMGAVTKTAWKVFNSIKEAMEEFEKITKQNVTDEGCNCCGSPHSFEWWKQEDTKNGMKVKIEYISGEECSKYLLEEDLSKLSKRELLNKLK